MDTTCGLIMIKLASLDVAGGWWLVVGGLVGFADELAFVSEVLLKIKEKLGSNGNFVGLARRDAAAFCVIYSDVKDLLPGISVAWRLGVFGWRIDGRGLFSVDMPRREFCHRGARRGGLVSRSTLVAASVRSFGIRAQERDQSGDPPHFLIDDAGALLRSPSSAGAIDRSGHVHCRPLKSTFHSPTSQCYRRTGQNPALLS